MTRPKLTRNYPSIYLRYADELQKNPALKIEIDFETPRDAKAFRLDFNAFKGAAIKEELDKTFPEISAFYVEVKGNKAIVSHRDHTDQADRMERALGRARLGPLIKGGEM
jgi:hypothetical protein